MLELLVKDWSGEDVVHQGLSTGAGGEHVLPDVAVASLHESLRQKGVRKEGGREGKAGRMMKMMMMMSQPGWRQRSGGGGVYS